MRVTIESLALACGCIAWLALVPTHGLAQESANDVQIEIVNQDGEKVRPSAIELKKQDADSAKAGITVENKDGKIVIIDADGSRREIDVQGAQSIIVNQSAKSIMENGEQKTETFGKAIIIGPDGKRQEIQLGAPIEGAAVMNWDGIEFPSAFAGVFKADRMDNRFMIGVNCEPVSETLSAQLQLESGTGLVVSYVGPDSPAEAAGVQMHDILMFADDRQLEKQLDLIESIQTAGKEKNKIQLTVIRVGKEIEIEVSPIERPAMTVDVTPGMPQKLQVIPDLNLDRRNFNFKFKQMGPGVIIGDDMQQDLRIQFEDQMKQMKIQMEQLEKQMKEQFEGGKNGN